MNPSSPSEQKDGFFISSCVESQKNQKTFRKVLDEYRQVCYYNTCQEEIARTKTPLEPERARKEVTPNEKLSV